MGAFTFDHEDDSYVCPDDQRLPPSNRKFSTPRPADAIGVTRQTIHAIETCKYSPSLEGAFCIAITFDVGLEDIFSWNAEAADG